MAIEKPEPHPKAGRRGRTAAGFGTRSNGPPLWRATLKATSSNRVQKVRQMSSVVLDEAGYDPSLRFVLVAAALFVLFLVVVLLNKLIT